MNTFRLAPDQASPMAASVDALFLFILCVALFFTCLIATLVLVFIIKYRRRNEEDVGADVGNHNWLEWTWSAIPMGIALVMFFWGAHLYMVMSQPPRDALQINIIGKQWMWKIQHASGRKEINELHVPINRTIKLVMTSQDVIHAFYLPAFRIKQDVLPGRYSEEWFTPTKLGEYRLFCTEYCGTGHATMNGRIVVMPAEDYEQWAANADLDARPETAGAHLFTQYGCINCHSSQAPTLAGIYGKEQPLSDGRSVIANDDYLRESILNSRAKIVAGYPPIMPSYQGQLSEEQLYQLIAYIKSLKGAVQRPIAISP